MQQGWLYTNGQIHSPSGAFDYIDGTIDNSSTWKNFDVVAAADGVAVWDDSPTSGYGNVVLIRHDQTDDQGRHFFTLYAHLKDGTINTAIPKLGRFNTQFQKWARVFAGEVIGRSGATGSQQCTVKAQCIHLHFEVRLGAYTGTSLDPYDISKVGGNQFKRDRYPGGDKFTDCGAAYLWTACPPVGPPSSVIARATLDGSPWPTPGSVGAVSYNIVGPNGVIIGLGVPAQTSGLVVGQYTLFYNSGGPPNSSLISISPSIVQTLESGKSITFTLQFASNSPTPTPLPGQILFVHDGTASGAIAGKPFSSTSFRITAIGETISRQSFQGGFFIDHISASISISGVGDFQFVTPTRTFVNQQLFLVGFSRAGILGADLFNGPTNGSFGTWDMRSSIGTITGNANVLQWDFADVLTSGGVLRLNPGFTPASFNATVNTSNAALLMFFEQPSIQVGTEAGSTSNSSSLNRLCVEPSSNGNVQQISVSGVLSAPCSY